MANEKLEAQYRDIMDRHKTKAEEKLINDVDAASQIAATATLASESEEEIQDRRTKGKPSPLDNIGIIDIYLLLWKVLIATAIFAIPIVIIYALIQSR